MGSKTSSRRDLGDFQTPPELVSSVLRALTRERGSWARVLEPTCGRGNFVAGVLEMDRPPKEMVGIEIQDDHLRAARRMARGSKSTRVSIRKANLFATDLRRFLKWESTGSLLVVGNPPWVTSSELGALGSDNLPEKSNLKNLRGIEALTGASNFDIAEYMWLKLIQELAAENPTIALLCKTSVARNVLKFAHDARLPIIDAFLRRINAPKWFGAAVDACLFAVTLGRGQPNYTASVYADLAATEPETTIGVVDGQLVSDLTAYGRSRFADGESPLTWRQGLKHDAARVMELEHNEAGLTNKLGEVVDVEPAHVYPLLKSSDLNNGCEHRLSVIVTQTRLGEDTKTLEARAPKLWEYLSRHASYFDRRKSSLYINKPPFSMFGIGDYSFAPFKVGISGLYKTPRFRAIGPVGGRPVMLDDTCYFIPCHSPQQAALVAALLNHPMCMDLIHALVFWDAKRPITKKLLQRINLTAILERVERGALVRAAEDTVGALGHTTRSKQGQWPTQLTQVIVDFERQEEPLRLI